MITDRDDEFRATITALFRKHFPTRPDYPTAEQMAAYLTFCRGGGTGAQIDAMLAAEPEAIAIANRPKYTAPPLVIQDRDFLDASGHRIVHTGLDGFPWFQTFAQGGSLDPFYDEAHEVGATLIRVWFMGAGSQNGVVDLDPREHYDAVRPFVEEANKQGFNILGDVNVDAQVVLRDPADQLANWHEITSRFVGLGCLASVGNEYRKNGFDPGIFPAPAGVLWARGSDLGDNPPFNPPGSFMLFHPRRDFPKALMDAAASPLWSWFEAHYPFVPFCVDEPPPMGTLRVTPEYSDPAVCEQFGRIYGALCGFAVFHNRFSQAGQLMDAGTKACAQRFLAALND